MRYFSIKLPIDALDENIIIEAYGSKRIVFGLTFLANTMGLDIVESSQPNPDAVVSILPYGENSDSGFVELGIEHLFPGRFSFNRHSAKFIIEVKDAQSINFITQGRVSLSFGIASLILRGRNLSLLHGDLLQVPCFPGSVVLFGESGVGKSSAARRFGSRGGLALADDKLLLSMDKNGVFWGQPLPTWSDWKNRYNRIAYNSSHKIKIDGIFQLSRGDGDKIEPADPTQWKIGLTRALSTHYTCLSFYFTKELVGELVNHVMALVEPLQKQFGSLELLGDLNGDLYGTFFRFLKEKINYES